MLKSKDKKPRKVEERCQGVLRTYHRRVLIMLFEGSLSLRAELRFDIKSRQSKSNHTQIILRRSHVGGTDAQSNNRLRDASGPTTPL